MPFAQLVIGPPGSGKSTYCNGMHQFMGAIGRKCSIVNLDPANDQTSYPVALDVRELVTLEEIMEAEELGPNGGVLYALEELEHNLEWLDNGLKELGDDYILFDCPGQVELFTHHTSLRRIFLRLEKLGYRLVVLHLTDSFCMTQPSLYISALLLALRAMLQMDLPHLNVLTKIDNLNNYPDLPFNLDYYTEVQDLEYLLPHLNAEQNSRFGSRQPPATTAEPSATDPDPEDPTPTSSKFSALNSAIATLIQDFALLSFHTLAVEDKTSMTHLLRAIDRATGYVYGGAEGANDSIWQIATRSDNVVMEARDVQERWLDRREELDREEEEGWIAEAEMKRREAEESREQGPAPTEDEAIRKAIESGDLSVEEAMQILKERGTGGRGESGVQIVRKG